MLQEARDELEKRNRLERELQQYVASKQLEEALEKGPDDTQVESTEKHDRLINTVLSVHAKKPKKIDFPPGEVTHLSAVPGFMQYDRNRQPQDFGLFRYAVDVSIPVVDLHAYSQYFPASKGPRILTTFQHILGWWVLTSLLATLAVF